jgi:hypothetical protein
LILPIPAFNKFFIPMQLQVFDPFYGNAPETAFFDPLLEASMACLVGWI